MKKKLIAAMLVAMTVFAGCNSEGGDASSTPVLQTLEAEPITSIEESTVEESVVESTVEESEAVVDETGSLTITDRPVVNGKKQSYLTGEWKDASVVDRRCMAVMVPNNKPAMPQYGISKASIIYEAPVEGRITRLMCVFEDYDDLDRIGPVRSSRDYYVYEAMALDAIYVNWGLAVPFVAPIINTDRIDNVSQSNQGIDVPSPEAFDRYSRPGYATEFTGYLKISGYNKAVENRKYSTEIRPERFTKAYEFAADGHKAEYKDYPDATKIYPGGNKSNSGGYGDAKPCFEYHADEGVYYRSQYGGPHIDEYNGEQLKVSNIIFKICHGEVRDPKEKDYLAFAVHGQNDCYVFTNGKVIKGTWKRNSDNEPNLLFDENGNEIVLNQGKTWICNIWQEYQEFISYE